ncbi:4-hydroxy-2-oxoheptanedioate aldolase [Scopulibacillus darangshiensis]|uniref:4-hydroxy-2-oxoheptanedioate aldolase n=1 Tax=Scopulibacillus darangshiensis TaxID=442528 RepID=A0A4R2PAM1_9BACL|nr:aldolase/citrate lyase family protein [Scopulibacillus darangshiensis]TCP30945.1 4-hydroxy-2-oxoheptanedioate aldolase [Scopulibacillus darangshiensis]
MLRNMVKEKLKKGEPSIGCILGLYSPALVEMFGHAGYEFIVIDDEHGAFSWTELEEMIRTALLVDLVPIVRTNYDPSSIQKALDRGALGIQVPMVNTKGDAETVVDRATFPPKGKRGTAFSMRAAGYGYHGGKRFMDASDENILISVHIETSEAVENFEEIMSVPGIDIAFIGPTDLSVNMGHKADGDNHPEVLKKIDLVYEKARILNAYVGTIATNKEEVKKAFQKGALFVPVVATSVMKNAFNGVLSI